MSAQQKKIAGTVVILLVSMWALNNVEFLRPVKDAVMG